MTNDEITEIVSGLTLTLYRLGTIDEITKPYSRCQFTIFHTAIMKYWIGRYDK